ncbi:MAG: hypothetical protein RI957_1287 [Verrucomicrobiota bacterium]|jgi:hypothetical protein
MELMDQLGVAFGLATLAGLNLYLTVALVGAAIRFQWISLSGAYEHLAVLGNPWILGVAGTLFAIEFIADKVPWVDSTWDAVHTLIRPAGAILLALTAMGDLHPVMTVIAALCAGTAALATHGTKASARLVMNASPEPISNTVASLAEDGLVVGGIALISAAPLVALVVFVVLVILCLMLTRWLWKKVSGLRGNRRGMAGGGA